MNINLTNMKKPGNKTKKQQTNKNNKKQETHC